MEKEASIENGLRTVAMLTSAMRFKETEIAALAEKRYAKVLWLREQKVTYAQLAEAMGISEVRVYKVLRGHGKPLREKNKDDKTDDS